MELTGADLRVYSEDPQLSRERPGAQQEITVFAKIRYWATSTDMVAQDVPVNFYATRPPAERILIGRSFIESLSAGGPDWGSRYVYTTWKNDGNDIYLLEVEIDASYIEANMTNKCGNSCGHRR